MKSIECRGYCLNCEAWVYGYYVVANENTHWIVQMNCFGKLLKNETHRVDPETVGQYTGLLDKAGREIYVGDNLVFESKRSSYFTEIKYGKYEYYPENCICEADPEEGYGIYCQLNDKQFPPGKWLNRYEIIP